MEVEAAATTTATDNSQVKETDGEGVDASKASQGKTPNGNDTGDAVDAPEKDDDDAQGDEQDGEAMGDDDEAEEEEEETEEAAAARAAELAAGDTERAEELPAAIVARLHLVEVTEGVPDSDEAQACREAHNAANPVKAPWCRHLTDEGVRALRSSLNADGVREYYLVEVNQISSLSSLPLSPPPVSLPPPPTTTTTTSTSTKTTMTTITSTGPPITVTSTYHHQ